MSLSCHAEPWFKVAQKIANKKEWKHSKEEERNNYGENLAWNTEESIERAIKFAIDGFYREIRYYNFAEPNTEGPNGEEVMHFTQVKS